MIGDYYHWCRIGNHHWRKDYELNPDKTFPKNIESEKTCPEHEKIEVKKSG